jgi:hypothetical protein
MKARNTGWGRIQKSLDRGWTSIPEDKIEQWKSVVDEEFASEQFYEELMTRGLPYAENAKAENGHKCLLVLGPSATGKTYCLQYIADGRLPLDGCYTRSFVLDGARFRDISKSWTKLKKEAVDEGFTGYQDGYDTCMKKATDALKLKLTTRLLNDGANLIIPDTCSNPSSVVKKCAMLTEAGYTLDVLVVIAPKSVCMQRGTAREQHEGKKYSSKNWQKSMESVEVVINYLRDHGSTSEMYVVDSGGMAESPKNGEGEPEDSAEVQGTSPVHVADATNAIEHVRPRLVLTLKGGERIHGQVQDSRETVTYIALPPEMDDGVAKEDKDADDTIPEDSDEDLLEGPEGCMPLRCDIL